MAPPAARRGTRSATGTARPASCYRRSTRRARRPTAAATGAPAIRGAGYGGELAAGAPAGRAVNRPAAGGAGIAAPGRGWAAVPAAGRVPVFQAPTSEVGGLFPLLAANGVPAVGARMGYDALSGGAFYCHPVEWLLRGLATNPNMVIFGEPGPGQELDRGGVRAADDAVRHQDPDLRGREGRVHPAAARAGGHPDRAGPGQPGPAERAGPRAARRRAGTAGRPRGSARSSPGCSAGGPRCSPRWPRPRATGPR